MAIAEATLFREQQSGVEERYLEANKKEFQRLGRFFNTLLKRILTHDRADVPNPAVDNL
jgi:hypothetical protein